MAFKKIYAPSIKELFTSQIKEMILSGEIKPGDKLPSERELADEMGISKTIVHEGIRDLVRLGFLNVESRKGVFVADYMKTGNINTLLAMIDYRGGMPDSRLIICLLDVRTYLEIPALQIVASHRTEENLKELESLEKQVAAAINSEPEDFANALFQYRRAITAMSGNVISVLIMNAFFTGCLSAWVNFCLFFGMEKVYQSVCETSRAIRNHDARKAIAIFEESINLYKAYIMEAKSQS